MPAGKVAVDTNVYVMAIRQGRDGPAGARLVEWFPRSYLVSVVSAELRAGARSRQARREVENFTAAFEQVGRVITPTAHSWNEAGDTLALIARARPDLGAAVLDLWNDALIALSARQVGATVVSANINDFTLLLEHVDFRFEPFATSAIDRRGSAFTARRRAQREPREP